MIAFATAVTLALLGDLAVVRYSKRRAPGRYLTWGEAMLAATFAFVLFNLWYGVIPHQWITLADNEWGWRSDRILYGPFDVFEPNRFLPITISYQVLRDIVVTLIYGVGLTLHVFHWVQWNNRGKAKAEVVPTTTYGRPLARKA
ncbi:MAG: hypothetical protein ABL966_02290 [Acidimicrobiales bacterium]